MTPWCGRQEKQQEDAERALLCSFLLLSACPSPSPTLPFVFRNPRKGYAKDQNEVLAFNSQLAVRCPLSQQASKYWNSQDTCGDSWKTSASAHGLLVSCERQWAFSWPLIIRTLLSSGSVGMLLNTIHLAHRNYNRRACNPQNLWLVPPCPAVKGSSI